MNEPAIDVPWLKIFATGFKHGIKWAGLGLLAELPILISMLLGITSSEQAMPLVIGVAVTLSGLGCLFALCGLGVGAYMKYRWARYLALTIMVLFFAVPLSMAIFMPYALIFFVFFGVTSITEFLEILVVIPVCLLLLYWWSKIPIGLFIKAKVHASIWKWIVRTARKDQANRKRLKKFIKEEL